MQILDKEEILQNPGVVNGYALIGSYSEQPTKTGSSYFNGVLHAKGEVPFKVWQGMAFDTMKATQYEGKICQIYGKKNVYQGQTSIIIESIEEPLSDKQCADLGLKKTDFMAMRYDIESFYKSFHEMIKRNVSEKAYEVFTQVMMSVPEERFKEEFAAVYHHDNCVGGLLAHTWKVTKLSTMLKMYPEVLKHVSADILFLGCAFHDIGKVIEYSNGSMTDLGKIIDHNTIGIVMLATNREYITDRLGADGYNMLLSVIAQHHGEYGARPRTVVAYVVHLLDVLDSNLSSLNDLISQSGGGQVVMDGYKLT